MRVISQDGTFDIPYENCVFQRFRNDIWCLNNVFADNNDGIKIAEYSTEKRAIKAMEMLRDAYAGKFVTNAECIDDFDSRMKELMKHGFGTVVVKESDDFKVQFDNLNGYFQFPKDDEVYV